jgi:uncharacterized membrane protein YbaN (DUF454 family)
MVNVKYRSISTYAKKFIFRPPFPPVRIGTIGTLDPSLPLDAYVLIEWCLSKRYSPTLCTCVLSWVSYEEEGSNMKIKPELSAYLIFIFVVLHHIFKEILFAHLIILEQMPSTHSSITESMYYLLLSLRIIIAFWHKYQFWVNLYSSLINLINSKLCTNSLGIQIIDMIWNEF